MPPASKTSEGWSLWDREKVEAESHEIQRGRSSACVGTLGLSLVTPVETCVPTPLPSFPKTQRGEWMGVSIPNPTPSNTTIAIWGQPEGDLHDSSHNQPSVLKQETTIDVSVSSSKCHSACWCCVCAQAKGHPGLLPLSNCLFAPNTNILLYQLSGNSLSTHTQTQKAFPSTFSLRAPKVLFLKFFNFF